jgi:hypothetical protein
MPGCEWRASSSKAALPVALVQPDMTPGMMIDEPHKRAVDVLSTTRTMNGIL